MKRILFLALLFVLSDYALGQQLKISDLKGRAVGEVSGTYEVEAADPGVLSYGVKLDSLIAWGFIQAADLNQTGEIIFDDDGSVVAEGHASWHAAQDYLSIGSVSAALKFYPLNTISDGGTCKVDETNNELDCTQDTYLELGDIAAPGAPAEAGDGRLYAKTGNDGLFWHPQGGVERDLTQDFSSSVDVREVDTSPTISSISVLEFDQADGFVISNPSGSIARVDFTGGDITTVGNCTTGDCGIEGGTDVFPLLHEGVADANETTFSVDNPTVDRTISFPNASGEVSLLGQTISAAEIQSETITSAEIGPDAIAGSELLESLSFVPTGTWTMSSATLYPPNGTTPPTCTAGTPNKFFIDSDATSGQRLYLCEGAGGWVLQGDGGLTSSGTGSRITALEADTMLIPMWNLKTAAFQWIEVDSLWNQSATYKGDTQSGNGFGRRWIDSTQIDTEVEFDADFFDVATVDANQTVTATWTYSAATLASTWQTATLTDANPDTIEWNWDNGNNWTRTLGTDDVFIKNPTNIKQGWYSLRLCQPGGGNVAIEGWGTAFSGNPPIHEGAGVCTVFTMASHNGTNIDVGTARPEMWEAVVIGAKDTDLATTDSTLFQIPTNWTITDLHASVKVAPQETADADNSITIDVGTPTTSILSTTLRIDDNETGSNTATTPFVFATDHTLAQYDELVVDVTKVGDVTAGQELTVWIYYVSN